MKYDVRKTLGRLPLVAALLILATTVEADNPASLRATGVEFVQTAGAPFYTGRVGLWYNGSSLYFRGAGGSDTAVGGALAGTVGVNSGGTGFTSYTIGDILYASDTARFSKLGIGAATTVLTSNGSVPGWSLFGGDVSGSVSALSVQKLRGASITAGTPTNGELLIGKTSDGSWNPATLTAGGGITVTNGAGSITLGSTFGGDIAGSVSSATVGALQGRTVSNAAPSTGQVLGYDGSQWIGQNTATLNTISSSTSTTMLLKSYQANGTNPQFTFDTNNAVGSANPLLRVSTAGVKVMELQAQSSTHYLQFYDSAGSATSALVFNNSPGIYVYGTTYLHPYTNNAVALGATSNRWSSVWARAHYGTQVNSTTSGSVTVTPANGETVRITASGNITGIAVSDGVEGQRLTLILVQDAGGTSTWPSLMTNVRLAGGSFSKTTTANATDVVRLTWDSSITDWLEAGRATNVQ